MKLTSTSDKVQVVSTSTANTDVYATWGDYDPAVSPATDRVTFGRLISKITTATTTDVVPVPGSGDVRKVHILNIANVHASTSQTVTVQITDGTNTAVIDSFPLAAGERWSWREGVGARIIDANGLEKTSPIAVGQYTVQKLASDLANSTTTAAKVTGLDLACGPGTWIFEYWLYYTTVITTTGIKFGVNHTGTVAPFLYNLRVVTANITGADALADQDVLLTTGGLISAWAARAKSTSAPMITAGVDTNAGDMLAIVEGLAVVTVGGNMELYSASEVGTSSTSVKAGSALRLTKVG